MACPSWITSFETPCITDLGVLSSMIILNTLQTSFKPISDIERLKAWSIEDES